MSVVQKLWRLKISIEKSYMITLNVNNKMDTRHFYFFKIDLDRGHLCDSNGKKQIFLEMSILPPKIGLKFLGEQCGRRVMGYGLWFVCQDMSII